MGGTIRQIGQINRKSEKNIVGQKGAREVM